MNSTRTEKLKRLLRASAYPRRGQAKFTAANDHNPLILQDCPACRGTGKRDRRYYEDGQRVWALGTCAACDGTGNTGEIENYFVSEASKVPAATATPDADGWLRCPGCRIVFTTRDPHRWTGYRHIRCGQRIRLFYQ